MALELNQIDNRLRTSVPDSVTKVNTGYTEAAAGTAVNSEEDDQASVAKENAASVTGQDVYVRSKESLEAENKASETEQTKMSAEQRTALVESLKAQQAEQEKEFLNMIRKSLGEQANTFLKANATLSMDNDGMWHFLAEGNFTVDLETKTKAQEAISEDGEYGVKKTSERLFQFAQAWAGDDVEKMKKMQAAIQEGYEQATASWGKALPSICKDTIDATEKLFDDYYKKHSASSAAE
uniref:hypothetical protein n=1 Tax=Eubacterium cellulosolvens TaxID=29322 RepID=UPI0006890990|nr:hypothetical protein [[Eubacterium] cellulosolvens]